MATLGYILAREPNRHAEVIDTGEEVRGELFLQFNLDCHSRTVVPCNDEECPRGGSWEQVLSSRGLLRVQVNTTSR